MDHSEQILELKEMLRIIEQEKKEMIKRLEKLESETKWTTMKLEKLESTSKDKHNFGLVGVDCDC